MAVSNPIADPSADDIRPRVGGKDRGNRPLWIGIAIIVLAGGLLFVMLDNRRRALTAPAVRPRAADLAVAPAAVPPLYIPPERVDSTPAIEGVRSMPPVPVAPAPVPSPRRSQQAASNNATIVPTPPTVLSTLPPPAPVLNTSPVIVFDNTFGNGEPLTNAGAQNAGGAASLAATAIRARASRVANRSTIVPQGTLIAAVLETALDSTQSGPARALVSRNVANLAGTRVLIPRGSKLFGEYRGELAAGQNRAQVQWTRLVRPDGVTVALDSPAADRLGRAGIRGRVNTHFVERLTGALLQSGIDIGTAVASRQLADGSVLLALPGGVQGGGSPLLGSPPKPTLTIKAGTPIAVFVARDLDFTGVEGGR